MGSAPTPPPAPSAQTMINAQQGANQQTANTQQQANMVDLSNPYGSLNYSSTIGPNGNPVYSQTQQYSPIQQLLQGFSQGTGLTQGATGLSLAGNLAPSYAQAPNFFNGASSLTGQAENAVLPAYERFWAPQRAQLDTQLRNSGIMPGTPAYQQQVDALTQQQNLTGGSWLANFEPQAFQQGLQSYVAPEQMVSQLFGMGQPTNLPSTFAPGAPQVALSAPNAISAYQTQLGQQNYGYGQQVAAQNNLFSGLFGGASNIGSAAMLGMMLA